MADDADPTFLSDRTAPIASRSAPPDVVVEPRIAIGDSVQAGAALIVNTCGHGIDVLLAKGRVAKRPA